MASTRRVGPSLSGSPSVGTIAGRAGVIAMGGTGASPITVFFSCDGVAGAMAGGCGARPIMVCLGMPAGGAAGVGAIGAGGAAAGGAAAGGCGVIIPIIVCLNWPGTGTWGAGAGAA